MCRPDQETVRAANKNFKRDEYYAFGPLRDGRTALACVAGTLLGRGGGGVWEVYLWSWESWLLKCSVRDFLPLNDTYRQNAVYWLHVTCSAPVWLDQDLCNFSELRWKLVNENYSGILNHVTHVELIELFPVDSHEKFWKYFRSFQRVLVEYFLRYSITDYDRIK